MAYTFSISSLRLHGLTLFSTDVTVLAETRHGVPAVHHGAKVFVNWTGVVFVQTWE